MAEIVPPFDVADAVDETTGTLGQLAFVTLAGIMGCITDGTSPDRPRIGRIIWVTPDTVGGVNTALTEIKNRDTAEGARAAREYIVVQCTPGLYDASDVYFDGHTDVIVRGWGAATRFLATESAKGSSPNFWPDSFNFSNNTRCGIENLSIVFQDGGTQNTVEQAAIARASNGSLDECWIKDVWITVEEMDSGRTNNTAMIFAIGYLPGATSSDGTTVWACKHHNVQIESSCCGVIPGEGEWDYQGCSINFGNTQNTSTPHLIGLDYQRSGRWYWRGGKITTGYQGNANTNTDAAVYGIRANQETTGGRGFLRGADIFARNEADNPGNVYAIYMDNVTSPGGNGWIRAWDCYLQAEHSQSSPGPAKDPEAIFTDWSPNNDVNKIELYNCRHAGAKGNVLGPQGRIIWAADYQMQSHEFGNWFIDTTSADVTITLHSNDPSTNEECYFKNYTGTNNLIIAVQSQDYLDGVQDGSLTVPPGGSVRVRTLDLVESTEDLYFETCERNFQTVSDDRQLMIGGSIMTDQVIGRIIVRVASNEKVTFEGVEHYITSGTSLEFDVYRNGSGVAGLSGTSPQVKATTTQTENAPSGTVTLTDGDYFEVKNLEATGTPKNASILFKFDRTTIR